MYPSYMMHHWRRIEVTKYRYLRLNMAKAWFDLSAWGIRASELGHLPLQRRLPLSQDGVLHGSADPLHYRWQLRTQW